MSKFASQTPARTQVKVAIKSTEAAVNHEGVPAFKRDAKSELFLLGVTNFVSEDTFYESGKSRDERYERLVHAVTAEDPEWVQNFVSYLRNTANMRSVAIVTACEYIKAGGPDGRRVIDAACVRADEPAEVLAYWINKYGRPVPSAVKRGIGDAARRLYTERNQIKYDSSNSNWRWADVIQMAHVKAKDERQNSLFGYLLDQRYNKDVNFAGEALPMLGKRRDLLALPNERARELVISEPQRLKEAGMTWEALSSLGAMDKAAWEAMIPSMGYMALLRNLRNFDQAGVSDKVAAEICARLSDPEEVAKSRQLPFRFYSAYVNAPSLRWGHALETALDLSLANIQPFTGKSLVLVDTSASMTSTGYSARSTVSPVTAAALFGNALTRTGDTRIVVFATYTAEFDFPVGGSVLKGMDKMLNSVGRVGHGTDIPSAIAQWRGEDRIILLTDMQSTHYMGRINVPDVPIYAFNLQGYATTVVDPDKKMFEFGGLTDNTFQMINALETGARAVWPWDK